MKKKYRNYIPFILIFVIITSSIVYSFNNSYASNFKVIGDIEGLSIIPVDTKMFDLKNLNPGDTYDTEIILENKYKECYIDIYLRTEKIHEKLGKNGAELFDQLKLTVKLDGETLYDNKSMKDFAKSNISLGRINPNKIKTMIVEVHLPGSETGNDFQATEINVNWIFTAQSDCPGPGSNPDPDSNSDSEEPEEPEGSEEPEEPEEPEESEKPEKPEDGDKDKDEIIPEDSERPEDDGKEENKPKPEKPEDPKKPQKPEATKKPESIIDRLVQTGATPDALYFALGGLMLVFGMGVSKKKK